MRHALLFALLLVAQSGVAGECSWWDAPPDSDLRRFTRVLLPVYNAPTSGAYGTLWSTSLRVANTSSHSVCIFPARGVFNIGPVAGTLQPGARQNLMLFTPSQNPARIPATPAPVPARIIYVDPDGTDSIGFRLTANVGRLQTEIPAVRESDLRNQLLLASDERYDPSKRIRLRLYSLSTESAILVRVRLLTSGEALAETEVEIPASTVLFPGYREIGDFAKTFPSVVPDGYPLVVPETFDVEVTALSPIDARLWAFMTITDNESQFVTLVTPR